MSEQPIWRPDPAHAFTTRMHDFTARVGITEPDPTLAYERLWRWSIDEPEAFWSEMWSFAGIRGMRGERVLAKGDDMLDARWFPDARLNFAENLLADRDPDSMAVIFWSEEGCVRRIRHSELFADVAALTAALRAHGIVAGDRIAAFMPNIPETLVAMLAAASIGAIFTSTSPDFGTSGVLDRFGQSKPRILFAVDGYRYNGKAIDCRERLCEIATQLPSVERLVFTRYRAPAAAPPELANLVAFEDFVAPYRGAQTIDFEQFPFAHPLYILYSSGTTGPPKGIVHGAGGTLLQHLKEHQLHCDVRQGDRYFYFTTCGWTMWNILVSVLASRATILMYDGSPFAREGRILFDLAAEERMTHFGTSAKFIDTLAKKGLKPRVTHDLAAMRVLLSTGSPLCAESYDYVYECIKEDVQLSSMSGGTDICSAFVIGNPTTPVWRGEIQCRGLGMAVDVFDELGRSIAHGKGELVCTQAFPSMPLGFWNDPHRLRLRAAYFDKFAGVWCHGDFCEITPHGGIIVHGRSDATLNPGGVRIGTAEIYREVEKIPEVIESLAIGQQWQSDTRIVLFVRLAEGVELDASLENRIRSQVGQNSTPRHVPARIIAVPDIPRTKNGKIVELAVANVVRGEPVRNLESLANPEALEWFRKRPELEV